MRKTEALPMRKTYTQKQCYSVQKHISSLHKLTLYIVDCCRHNQLIAHAQHINTWKNSIFPHKVLIFCELFEKFRKFSIFPSLRFFIRVSPSIFKDGGGCHQYKYRTNAKLLKQRKHSIYGILVIFPTNERFFIQENT